jgi:hypothetical protein
MAMKFEHWEEAAMGSKFRRAVARFGFVEHNGKRLKADIWMEQGGNGYLVYSRTGRKIRQATTREIDTVKGWEPF